MALNKQQTSMATKVVIVVLILVFVLGVGGVFSQLDLSSLPSASSGTSTQTVQQKVDAINAQYQPGVTASEAALKAKPKDYDLLKSLAQEYYDWALQIRQAAQNASDAPVWQRSASYYKRALAVKAGDANVETDYSIATYYSGDAAGAIKIIEGVIKKNPTFAPAPFNAGIFYASSGNNAKAAEEWNAYLKLEPNGQNAATAKQFLSQLAAQNSQTQPTSATTATP